MMYNYSRRTSTSKPTMQVQTPSTKRITTNIPAYIKSVVELEEKIKWAKSPGVEIPKDMKYPVSKKWTPTSKYAFISQFLP